MLAWRDAEPQDAVCLKLTLSSPILGDRHIYHKTAACSVGLSTLLELSRERLPESFEFFPEPLGFTPRRLLDGSFIVRTIPQRILLGQERAVPLFALLGGLQGRRPMLLTILEATKMSLWEFVREVLCERFARLWVCLYFRLGLILEAHGQDVLLAVDPDFRPADRFYYRDLEGLQVDWELRRRVGLPTPQEMPRASQWFDTYDTWGYRGYQLTCTKVRTSLFDYMHFVLREVEIEARNWRRAGLVSGPEIVEGEGVRCFASALAEQIKAQLGIPMTVGYDAFAELNRFTLELMSVRRTLLG
jgi:hypothetical protein